MEKMTVNELIEDLQQVKDKEKKVKLSVNDMVVSKFHINDNIAPTMYLSNYGEEGYRTQPLD
jgi:hypothetical protein